MILQSCQIRQSLPHLRPQKHCFAAVKVVRTDLLEETTAAETEHGKEKVLERNHTQIQSHKYSLAINLHLFPMSKGLKSALSPCTIVCCAARPCACCCTKFGSSVELNRNFNICRRSEKVNNVYYCLWRLIYMYINQLSVII